MKTRIIHQYVNLPDGTIATRNSKTFYIAAVVLQNKQGQWFAFSWHTTMSLATRKVIQCKNTFSLRGVKDVDWFSARAVVVRGE